MTASQSQNKLRKNSDFVAAADLGSNSFHLIIARYDNDRLIVVDAIKEIVRLGGGLDHQSNLTLAARQRALGCLRQFGQRLRDIPPSNIRAVATNTFRKARNSHQFLPEAEEALGHSIEIISGHEEARLIYESVCYGLSMKTENQLVIDIGGGSTEIIAGAEHDPHLIASLDIGCVGLTKSRFPDGWISASRMEQAELDAQLEVRTVRHKFLDHGWEETIGCSGTIRAVAEAIQYLGLNNGIIDKQSLLALRSKILQFKHTSELMEIGFDERRSEVIPGGYAIVSALFTMLNINNLEVSKVALREGVMYDILGRLGNDDAREKSVYSLVHHWSVDLEHAQRVQKIALDMYDQVCKSWFKDNPDFRNLLSWAAVLHEVGLTVTHANHHEHGAYLLEFTDMAGFSRGEQAALAILVRSHRSIWPVEFRSLIAKSHAPKKILKRLCVLLRLAVLLHRPRTNRFDLSIDCRAKKKSISLRFPPGWLQQHPLTLADLQQEQFNLRMAKINLLY